MKLRGGGIKAREPPDFCLRARPGRVSAWGASRAPTFVFCSDRLDQRLPPHSTCSEDELSEERAADTSFLHRSRVIYHLPHAEYVERVLKLEVKAHASTLPRYPNARSRIPFALRFRACASSSATLSVLLERPVDPPARELGSELLVVYVGSVGAVEPLNRAPAPEPDKRGAGIE